jgi:hypothetical protein
MKQHEFRIDGIDVWYRGNLICFGPWYATVINWDAQPKPTQTNCAQITVNGGNTQTVPWIECGTNALLDLEDGVKGADFLDKILEYVGVISKVGGDRRRRNGLTPGQG